MMGTYRMRLATAYVPIQRYGRVWSSTEGLSRGTIFPELYSPYAATEKAR
jgi:hypothetical protein